MRHFRMRVGGATVGERRSEGGIVDVGTSIRGKMFCANGELSATRSSDTGPSGKEERKAPQILQWFEL